MYDQLHGKAVIFNDEGKLVEYTDEVFLIEVKKQDASPFTTMYKGFERKWAGYKVIVMALKLLQLLLTALATSQVMEKYLKSPKNQGTFKHQIVETSIIHCVTTLVCNYRKNYFYLFIPLIHVFSKIISFKQIQTSIY